MENAKKLLKNVSKNLHIYFAATDHGKANRAGDERGLDAGRAARGELRYGAAGLPGQPGEGPRPVHDSAPGLACFS